MKNEIKTDVAPARAGSHTPGVWHYTLAVEAGNPHRIVGANGATTVALIPCPASQQDDGESEADANARLIAAAPEMLAALKRVVECPDYRHIETHEMSNARAAIAAAEGRDA